MTTVQDPRYPARSCRSWCTVATAGIHECTSAPLVVPQSLNPSLLVDTVGVGVWVDDDVHLTIEQAYGDPEPHIVACWRDGTVRVLSVEETEQFIARATTLLALAAVSRSEVAA